MTKLIIAEKFKTAQPFAKAVGATMRRTTQNKGNVGYMEGNGWIVTWCAGHVVSPINPDEYDKKYKRWNLDDLPIVPQKWKYKASTQEPAKSQWKVLKELVQRSDIDEIYHAADADREGEMIVREILREAKADKNKKYYRLWYTNTTDSAVKRALAEAKPLSEYDSLGDAADCRQKLDWLLGFNMTRAYTVYGHSINNVGRVVSPTINLLVQRQEEIDNFVSEDYAVVTVPCKNADGDFKAEAKYTDIARAEQVAKTVKGKDAIITSIDKSTENETRKLYNTTQLQAEASKRFGYEPDETMKIMQELYDSGFISYPRTKSNLINPDQVAETEPLMGLAYSSLFRSPSQCSPDDFDVQRIVGTKGKSAEEASHTGLLPTDVGITNYIMSIKINEKKRNIFLLIAIRMLCSVLPPRVLDKTKISVDIDKEEFKANGSVEVDKGFIEFERYALAALKSVEKKTTKSRGQVLPPMNVGDVYTAGTGKCVKKKTTPPKQYTTAQLLSTMENISRLVNDKKMKELLKDAGLGTAASRDTIIKNIKKSGFVEVKSGYMYPTEKAKALMRLLPDDLKSPVMTGKMEIELDAIARGDEKAKDFLDKIKDRVEKEIGDVRAMKPIPNTKRYANNKQFMPNACPKCGADIVETDKSVVCRDNCGFIIWNTIAKRKIPKTEQKAILRDGHTTKKIDGFKSKKGSEFSCWLYIDANWEIKFDFSDDGKQAKTQNYYALTNAVKNS